MGILKYLRVSSRILEYPRVSSYFLENNKPTRFSFTTRAVCSHGLPFPPLASLCFTPGNIVFWGSKNREMKPKGNQKKPKGNQMKVKGRQRRARRRQREAKRGKGKL